MLLNGCSVTRHLLRSARSYELRIDLLRPSPQAWCRDHRQFTPGDEDTSAACFINSYPGTQASTDNARLGRREASSRFEPDIFIGTGVGERRN
jgi:hypothetical protein